jgi:hypothetical protein
VLAAAAGAAQAATISLSTKLTSPPNLPYYTPVFRVTVTGVASQPGEADVFDQSTSTPCLPTVAQEMRGGYEGTQIGGGDFISGVISAAGPFSFSGSFSLADGKAPLRPSPPGTPPSWSVTLLCGYVGAFGGDTPIPPDATAQLKVCPPKQIPKGPTCGATTTAPKHKHKRHSRPKPKHHHRTKRKHDGRHKVHKHRLGSASPQP